MIRFLSASMLLLAVPAVAQEAAPVAPVAPAAAVAPVTPVAVMSPAEAYKAQIVCRSDQETGSLVKKHKTCLTRKQWAYLNDQHESFARKMIEDNTSHPAGN